jgi:hypothetical protein
MNPEDPYNPLDKTNLGISVADALLSRPAGPLPPRAAFSGAGIYAIYYTGNFAAYSRISESAAVPENAIPIYVGKAVPAGARKGTVALNTSPGNALYRRLQDHADSIENARNLRLRDFLCRWLVVDDIWIPLGEALLIQRFTPLWNQVLDGFGNHDPGSGRYNGQKPAWDVVHPGRAWADKCRPNQRTEREWISRIAAHLDAGSE